MAFPFVRRNIVHISMAFRAVLPFFFFSAFVPYVEGQRSEVNCDSLHIRPDGGTSFYENNPTYTDTDAGNDTFPWQPTPPPQLGLNADILAQGLATLENSPSLFSFLVLRNRHIAVEKYFNGSAPDHSNNIHSASKSILSAMIGIAIEQGYIDSIDQSIFDFFPDYPLSTDNPQKGNITIRHLLNMTAGLEWEEDFTEYIIEDEDDWTTAILALPLIHPPGSVFNYSTGNTHLLSAILARASGGNNCEYTHEQLLMPAGIAAEHWGRDPQEVHSGGYNFYITPREMAKFGMLYMDGGQWAGTQVIPQSWVEETLQSQVLVGGGYDYGYCWWLTNIAGYEIKKAWGYGGQYICLIPALNILVVSTSNTQTYFGEWDIDTFIENYIIPAADPEWTNTKPAPLESKSTSVAVVPNPFHTKAVFLFGEKNHTGKCRLKVFDTQGRPVQSVVYAAGEKVVLSRNSLPAGLYFFQIFEKGAGVASGKFVLQ